MLARLSDIYEVLKMKIDPDRIAYDEAISSAYTRDSSFTLTGISNYDFIVVQPISTEEVQYILRVANERKLKVLVKSWGTNLVGATIPHNIDILLDLKRMKKISIDPEFQVAVIEPGVTHGELFREAKKYGLKYIGPLAPHSASVIGNITYTSMKPGATRYGQDQVLALEVVLPTGEILRTGCWAFPDTMDITPYYRHAPLLDLNFLFLFTRGVFGVITKAAIRLYPMQEMDEIIVASFDNITNLVKVSEVLQYHYIPSLLLAMSGSYITRLFGKHIIDQLGDSILNSHILIAEIEGRKEQVEVNMKIAKEVIEKYGGKVIRDISRSELDKALVPSIYSPRMLQPYGSMLPIVVYLPTKYVGPYIEEVRSTLNSVNVHSEYVVYFQYHGQNAYVEIDVHYDPISTRRDDLIKVLSITSMIKRKYKGCSTSLSEFEKTGNYYDLALKIKKLLDPNDVLNPQRLFRGV